MAKSALLGVLIRVDGIRSSRLKIAKVSLFIGYLHHPPVIYVIVLLVIVSIGVENSLLTINTRSYTKY